MTKRQKNYGKFYEIIQKTIPLRHALAVFGEKNLL
jgi:hypothetical protein